MAKKVAELVVEVLADAGVRRIYGVSGDSLNGITDSIRVSKSLEWIHVRHEEAAAFAAGAGRTLPADWQYAPGVAVRQLHLINGLYDCHRSRVPVLAIAAQIPSGEIGERILSGNASGAPFRAVQPLLRVLLRIPSRCRVCWNRDAKCHFKTRRCGRRAPRRLEVALQDAVEQRPRLRFSVPKPRVCPSVDERNILADCSLKLKRSRFSLVQAAPALIMS